MVTHYDEKGKIFTSLISKNAVPATIQTLTHRLHGNIYIRQGERIKDELSRPEIFIAVTDATVYGAQEEVLYQAGFLVLNRDHIVWVIPDEDITDNRGSGEAE